MIAWALWVSGVYCFLTFELAVVATVCENIKVSKKRDKTNSESNALLL